MWHNRSQPSRNAEKKYRPISSHLSCDLQKQRPTAVYLQHRYHTDPEKSDGIQERQLDHRQRELNHSQMENQQVGAVAGFSVDEERQEKQHEKQTTNTGNGENNGNPNNRLAVKQTKTCLGRQGIA